MENKKEFLQVLIALACEDGEFHPRERQLIENIARRHHIAEEELIELIEKQEPLPTNLSDRPYKDRF